MMTCSPFLPFSFLLISQAWENLIVKLNYFFSLFSQNVKEITGGEILPAWNKGM